MVCWIGMAASASAQDRWTTGAKAWKMVDGHSWRLRFSGFTKDGSSGIFQSADGPQGEMKLKDFAAEEQEEFAALRDVRLKLVVTPGLAMLPEMANGTKVSPERDGFWLGEKRTWRSADGRSVEAALINLNEDAVTLFTGNRCAAIGLGDLLPTDLEYLDRLKRGEARMYPERTVLATRTWDKSPADYEVAVTGERYVSLAHEAGDFDRALAAVVKLVGSKLKPDEWELDSFEESPAFDISALHGSAAPPTVPEKRPLIYQATIRLKKGGVKEARRRWAATTSPAWPGEPEMMIFVLADGEIAEATPVKSN
jgi:hypothetical protein